MGCKEEHIPVILLQYSIAVFSRYYYCMSACLLSMPATWQVELTTSDYLPGSASSQSQFHDLLPHPPHPAPLKHMIGQSTGVHEAQRHAKVDASEELRASPEGPTHLEVM